LKYKEKGKGQLLSNLLDTRNEIDQGELYGRRGSKQRAQIGQYVDRWRRLTPQKYSTLCRKFGVKPFHEVNSPEPAVKPAVKKDRAKASRAVQQEEEFQSPSRQFRGPSFENFRTPKPTVADSSDEDPSPLPTKFTPVSASKMSSGDAPIGNFVRLLACLLLQSGSHQVAPLPS
jgi:hypothetical protein